MIQCRECGVEIFQKPGERPYRWRGKKFCSRECAAKATGRAAVVPLHERVWRNSTRLDSGCWLWTGVINASGYGVMKVNGKSTLAHRVSLEAFLGTSAKGKNVLHSCDNPPCVNPDHLRLGTQKDNAEDMVTRGRSARGERSGSAKLTEKQVLEILAMCERAEVSKAEIGRIYGVSHQTISDISLGKKWRHVHRAILPPGCER